MNACIDVHAAFVSSDFEVDRATFVGPILRSNQEALDAGLSDRFRALLTSTGENRLLAAIRSALANEASFFREDASLWILAISAREDMSQLSIDAFIDEVETFKGSRSDLRAAFSAVSGGTPGCEFGSSRAVPAPRLSDVAKLTGGNQASICFDRWASRLSPEYHSCELG